MKENGISRSAAKLLMLPETTLAGVMLSSPELAPLQALAPEVQEQIEIDCKYKDYLVRQERDIAHYRREEGLALPAGIDYLGMEQISTEERHRLHEARPATLGAARQLKGIRPSTTMYLLKWVRKQQGLDRTRGPPDTRSGSAVAGTGADLQDLVEARQ